MKVVMKKIPKELIEEAKKELKKLGIDVLADGTIDPHKRRVNKKIAYVLSKFTDGIILSGKIGYTFQKGNIWFVNKMPEWINFGGDYNE